MSNETLRIRTEVNGNVSSSSLHVDINQTYDTFEILSLKLRQSDVYKLHSANYGVIVGRVLANGNFGVPNAKISIFIEGNFENEELSNLYPYTSTASEDKNGVRYNLLPDEKIDDCHQVVGTFPNKTYLLDNDVLIEVFDTYYKYTTRTNNSGDYIIAGVPIGSQTLHMDLDLSDCGILSQRPRDFVYKGYTIEQFDNANQFKTDTNLASLSQIFSQDQIVNVIPFWGNENQGETIGITRADINIAFKFEPTCIFMGSLVADNSSNGISKKCVPTNQMGAMDELTTGEGTIEMIRYTPAGNIESFNIKGTQLIDGNGVWCYQIPMNLDYMMTDEYGNMVPTDDPEKGIPTRTRVRFRFSMQDMEKNTDNYFRAKVLVPHNPQNLSGNEGKHEDYDYEFGSDTREDSFRDLLWNNVYTVKSYIPRFQKSKTSRHTQRFTGIKHCNIYGQNNPMPYNNIRIKLPLMFTILCALIKSYIRVVFIVNNILNALMTILQKKLANIFEDIIDAIFGFIISIIKWFGRIFDFNTDNLDISKRLTKSLENMRYLSVADGLCPDLENWYFAPVKQPFKNDNIDVLQKTLDYLVNKDAEDQNLPMQDSGITSDAQSIDSKNKDDDQTKVCLTIYTDYLISCIEMALAQEYKVINFDFYNDWVNGVIYMPRWMRFVRPKRTFLFGLIKIKQKIKACMDDTSIFHKTRYYVQQCALKYKKNSDGLYAEVTTANGCVENKNKQKCHKNVGKQRYEIFGGSTSGKRHGNGGVVHEDETSRGEYVYYLKPCEWRKQNDNKKVNLFANDIVLLGSLLECNLYGIPQAFKYLTSSSYIMPTNLALTNMDDDGYLYADGDGIICNNISNELDERRAVKQVDNSFSGLSNYYSQSDEPITYGVNEGSDFGEVFDDTIPITEAAGIAWNYTGPGQGQKSNDVRKSLYMPGGHFLGISCTNSETNIKSCINLERICEIGSNMSQRREEVRKIVGTTNEFQYRYFVPTGLIANDEVNGSSFRNMFATMNHRRLLCENRFDEKTGYPIYDFIYLRPNGFDGALKRKIKDAAWNKQLEILDEYSEFPEVKKDVNYDYNETANTNTRTIEESKEDYYKFRFGIDDLSDGEQRKKFLKEDESHNVSLPQYENSFYFYFGLKDGSTAFDEFLKQFFSVCDTSSRLKKKMTLNMTSETINQCDFTSDIELEGLNGNGIITGRYEYYVDCDDNLQVVDLGIQMSVNGQFVYPISGLPFGSYKFIVSDENGTILTKEIEVGKDVITSKFSTTDFEFRTKGYTEDEIVGSGRTLNCGCIELTDLSYFDDTFPTDLTWSEIASNLVIIENSEKKYFGANIDKIPPCFKDEYTEVDAEVINPEDSEGKIYVWKADASYDIYLTSTGGSDCTGYIKLAIIIVEGIDNYDLYLGSMLLPYSTELAGLDYSSEWWRNIGSNQITDWAKRYALYRRTDYSGETFVNKVFALDNKGRIIDTVLFGAGENGSGKTNNVYYENSDIVENGQQYSLTDESICATTLSSSGILPIEEKQLYGEMAINGLAIVSDKVFTTTVNSTGTTTNQTNKYSFTTSDIVDNYKLKDKHGCIVKLEDGTLLFCIKDSDTTFIFADDMPDDIIGTSVSFYPIFYYPVINRPFYSKTYIADWLNANIVENYQGEIMLNHDMCKFISTFEIHNGLTYVDENQVPYKFDLLQIQDIDFTDKNRDVADNYGTETGGMPTSDAILNVSMVSGGSRVEVTDTGVNVIIEKYDNYTYTLRENGPKEPGESASDVEKEQYSKLLNPYNIDLITIEDSSNIQLSDSLSYRIDTGAEGLRFYKDTNDNNDYYLIQDTCPLERTGYTFKVDESDNHKYYLACLFGPESDKKLGAVYEDPDTADMTKFINQPGSQVLVEVFYDSPYIGMQIPFYSTDKSTTKVYKVIGNRGHNFFNDMISGNDYLYIYLQLNFDIRPILAYDLTDVSKTAKYMYETYIKSLETTKVLIPFDNDVITFDEIGIIIEEVISEDEEGHSYYTWKNKDEFFVIGLQKFNQSRDTKGYEKAVNGMGSTVIYRIYNGNNLVELPSYDSGANNPYLKIVPHGMDGIIAPPEPEQKKFIWTETNTNTTSVEADATATIKDDIGYNINGYTTVSTGVTYTDGDGWITSVNITIQNGYCTIIFTTNVDEQQSTTPRSAVINIYGDDDMETPIGTINFTQNGNTNYSFYWGNEGTQTTTGVTCGDTACDVSLTYRVQGYEGLTYDITYAEGETRVDWISGVTFNQETHTFNFSMDENTGETDSHAVININSTNPSVSEIGVVNVTQTSVMTRTFYWGDEGTETACTGDVGNLVTVSGNTYRTNYDESELVTTIQYEGEESEWITGVTLSEGLFSVEFTEYAAHIEQNYYTLWYPPRVAIINISVSGTEEPVATYTLKQGYEFDYSTDGGSNWSGGTPDYEEFDAFSHTETFKCRTEHLNNLRIGAYESWDEIEDRTPCDWVTAQLDSEGNVTISISANMTSSARTCEVDFISDESDLVDYIVIAQSIGGRNVTFTFSNNHFENSSHLGSAPLIIFNMRFQCLYNNEVVFEATYDDGGDGLVPGEGTNYPNGDWWTVNQGMTQNKFQIWVDYGVTYADFLLSFDHISGTDGEGGVPVSKVERADFTDSDTDVTITFQSVEWKNE